MPPAIEHIPIVGVPLLVARVLFGLPFWAAAGERNPGRRPWAVGAVGFSAMSIGLLAGYGGRAPWSPDLHPQPLPASVSGRLGGDAVHGAQLLQEKRCSACPLLAGDGGQRGPDLTTIGSQLEHQP